MCRLYTSDRLSCSILLRSSFGCLRSSCIEEWPQSIIEQQSHGMLTNPALPLSQPRCRLFYIFFFSAGSNFFSPFSISVCSHWYHAVKPSNFSCVKWAARSNFVQSPYLLWMPSSLCHFEPAILGHKIVSFVVHFVKDLLHSYGRVADSILSGWIPSWSSICTCICET